MLDTLVIPPAMNSLTASNTTNGGSNPIVCSQAPYGQDCCCCKRCGVGGCDLKVLPCNCCLHARCCPVSENQVLLNCPVCGVPATGLMLIPIAFAEIDQATAEAAQTSISSKRGKKRQNATVARLHPGLQSSATEDAGGAVGGDAGSELRTGRWTNEEAAYCDKLIHYFEQGQLPIPEKIKLNDFLSNMLKSKHSRLTKKMKNAKLSAKLYKRSVGHIMSDDEARSFSQLETDLFASIKCSMERAEIRFHMQKVWRELFSGFCLTIGQKLEIDAWLASVEEMDRRTADAKDAARKARREAMVGRALSHDAKNAVQGVIIERNQVPDRSSGLLLDRGEDVSEADSHSDSISGVKRARTSMHQTSSKKRPSSFVARVMQYIQLRRMPFEHVDIWVPSNDQNLSGFNGEQNQKRLMFAGCSTGDAKVLPSGANSVSLTSKEVSDLVSFGDYSQRFTFQFGSGLPGRVYISGAPSWEQGIQSLESNQFERVGGATQWGVETALGIPVTSPKVGQVIVVLYSIHDRPKDMDMANRIMEDLRRLIPAPRWKLVVDVGADAPSDSLPSIAVDSRETDLRTLVESLMGGNLNVSFPEFVPGLMSLRQLLVKTDRSMLETQMLQKVLNTYESHKREGRSDAEIAWFTCREFNMMSPAAQQITGTALGAALNPNTIQFNSGTLNGVAASQLMASSGCGTSASCQPGAVASSNEGGCCGPKKDCTPNTNALTAASSCGVGNLNAEQNGKNGCCPTSSSGACAPGACAPGACVPGACGPNLSTPSTSSILAGGLDATALANAGLTNVNMNNLVANQSQLLAGLQPGLSTLGQQLYGSNFGLANGPAFSAAASSIGGLAAMNNTNVAAAALQNGLGLIRNDPLGVQPSMHDNGFSMDDTTTTDAAGYGMTASQLAQLLQSENVSFHL